MVWHEAREGVRVLMGPRQVREPEPCLGPGPSADLKPEVPGGSSLGSPEGGRCPLPTSLESGPAGAAWTRAWVGQRGPPRGAPGPVLLTVGSWALWGWQSPGRTGSDACRSDAVAPSRVLFAGVLAGFRDAPVLILESPTDPACGGFKPPLSFTRTRTITFFFYGTSTCRK